MRFKDVPLHGSGLNAWVWQPTDTRVERGERIVIVRAGKAVAELRRVRNMKMRRIPLDDPLLRVDEYCYDGPIGSTTNRDIDSTVYDVQPSLLPQVGGARND